MEVEVEVVGLPEDDGVVEEEGVPVSLGVLVTDGVSEVDTDPVSVVLVLVLVVEEELTASELDTVGVAADVTVVVELTVSKLEAVTVRETEHEELTVLGVIEAVTMRFEVVLEGIDGLFGSLSLYCSELSCLFSSSFRGNFLPLIFQ